MLLLTFSRTVVVCLLVVCWSVFARDVQVHQQVCFLLPFSPANPLMLYISARVYVHAVIDLPRYTYYMNSMVIFFVILVSGCFSAPGCSGK